MTSAAVLSTALKMKIYARSNNILHSLALHKAVCKNMTMYRKFIIRVYFVSSLQTCKALILALISKKPFENWKIVYKTSLMLEIDRYQYSFKE